MPGMQQSLLQQGTGYLKAVCSLWGLSSLSGFSDSATAGLLMEKILRPNVAESLILNAEENVTRAVKLLVRNNGSLPFQVFRARFGDVRVMGEVRLEREKPWLSLQSATEWLWYHGIIQIGMLPLEKRDRAAIDEFVFIPDELFAVLSTAQGFFVSDEEKTDLIIRPASPEEVSQSKPADDTIVDLCCILLAAYRTGNSIEPLEAVYGTRETKFLYRLLDIMQIIEPGGIPNPEKTQTFLQISRDQTIAQLFAAWANTAAVDDLRAVETLLVDDLADYSPEWIRGAVLSELSRITENQWWSVGSFISHFRISQPNFLRPNGENTTWLIRNQVMDHFNQWENIEGFYVRYLLSGPLNWLGLVDVAYKKEISGADLPNICAFRIQKKWKKLLQNFRKEIEFPAVISGHGSEQELPRINADGRILLSNKTSRIFRYHTARYCDWGKIEKKQWEFRITPQSLQRARENGLTINSYIGMMRRISGKGVPEKLLAAMVQWDQKHTQASIYQATLLTVSDPEWIEALISQKNTARWIEQQINKNTIIIKPKGENVIRRALIELGALVDKLS